MAWRGPLEGILVVDLSRAVAGPQAAQMLGDLGARIIKIESPDGDDSRRWGPPFLEGESTYFLSINRNKESVVIDLKTDEGREVLAALLERADVVIENFRTGTLARLGFSDERIRELNPRAILLSITGFGHDGPEEGRPGYDQIAQGEAGLMSVTGSGPDDPQRVGVPIADVLAGMNGAFGIVAALFDREKTGEGRIIRTSLLASVVGAHVFQGTAQTVAGVTGTARGNHHPSLAPYGLFHCKDTHMQIAVGTEGHWRGLCRVLDLPHDERFDTNRGRVENRDALVPVIESALATWAIDDVLEALTEAGVPAGRVRSLDEVYSWDQTRSQGLVIPVEHSTLGAIDIPGPPLRWFDGATEVTPTAHTAPPTLGEHTERVLRWIAGG
jgi:crotonobetainyl-CoA:carnitine CoA-transferase CaiB-like acyl-CoA transferase